MKPVADSKGNVIEGLYRNPDGSLALNNNTAFQKSKTQHDKFNHLLDEVSLLKEQMSIILEKLNG